MKKPLDVDLADLAVRTVFRRCLLFFLASGVEEEALRSEFDLAMKWSKKKRVQPKIFRAGPTRPMIDICEKWQRDPSYLNKGGNPRPLPIHGPQSIQSIMLELGIKKDVESVVKLMIKVGSVIRAGRGKYVIPVRGFLAQRAKTVAFEPYAHFLMQAVTAATLRINIKSSDKHSYWSTSTCNGLTEKEMVSFYNFVKRKSPSQLAELDEWFLARKKRIGSRRKNRSARNTVAVGMFTCVTEPAAT